MIFKKDMNVFKEGENIMRKVSKNMLLSILTICFSFNAFNAVIFCAAGRGGNIMDLKFEGDPVLR